MPGHGHQDEPKCHRGISGPDLLDEQTLDYAAVVAHPEKILCIGWNYLSHIEETKIRIDLPKYPEVFAVTGNVFSAHGKPIKLPKTAKQYDYEVERVMVIGRECSMIPEESTGHQCEISAS